MKKLIKRKSPSVKLPPHGDASQHPNGHASQPVGPDITDMVNKVSQQLVSLEKKIDTLISRPSERPSEEKYFSRPHQRFDETQHRRFDRSQRNNRGNEDNRPRERTFNQAICADCKKTCEVPFRPSGDRPVYCRDCFAKRKEGGSFKRNRDNRPRERGFAQRRRFGTP